MHALRAQQATWCRGWREMVCGDGVCWRCGRKPRRQGVGHDQGARQRHGADRCLVDGDVAARLQRKRAQGLPDVPVSPLGHTSTPSAMLQPCHTAAPACVPDSAHPVQHAHMHALLHHANGVALSTPAASTSPILRPVFLRPPTSLVAPPSPFSLPPPLSRPSASPVRTCAWRASSGRAKEEEA